eukprot:GAHX01000309.1.p2 GENE.GAHX01000309.1~~GAHX01000309.1.p2  ORF type:complete len:172 (-),score=39.46 GAHX01000309.1:250-765(-)
MPDTKETSAEVQVAVGNPKRLSVSNSSSLSVEDTKEKKRDSRNLNKLKAFYGISNDELQRFEIFLQNAEKLSKKLGENMTVKEIEKNFNSTRDSMISKYLRRCKETYHTEIQESKTDKTSSSDSKGEKASKVMGFKGADKTLVEKIKKAVILVDEEEEDAIKYVKNLNFKE